MNTCCALTSPLHYSLCLGLLIRPSFFSISYFYPFQFGTTASSVFPFFSLCMFISLVLILFKFLSVPVFVFFISGLFEFDNIGRVIEFSFLFIASYFYSSFRPL